MAKIEKGISIPEPQFRKTKYPWRELAVGDCFVYDGPMNAAQTNCRYSEQKLGKKLEARIYKGQVRVWRTS